MSKKSNQNLGMLHSICCSQSIEKILLFLFVHGSCYGAQLQKALKTPLTPLQNALARLEKAHILISRWDGKAKIYSFNEQFPLIEELMSLLKKVFILQSDEKKKEYTQLISPHKINRKDLVHFWNRLKEIGEFTRDTKSFGLPSINAPQHRYLSGSGEVTLATPQEEMLIFHERGSWKLESGTDMDFSNTFRWILDYKQGTLSLEHLRYGMSDPILLFHLMAIDGNKLASNAHLCGQDFYMARIQWDRTAIHLICRLIGPHKNEEMHYYYQ